MDALEAIFTRRSIRVFDPRPVSDESLRVLLKAAMSAPSAGNEQPWYFVVVRDRELFERILKFHPYSHSLKSASLAVLVCADLDLEKYSGYWTQDCSAAAQNLLLAAHAQGLGGVWLGIYPIEERIQGVRSLFGLPANVVPMAILPIGYPAETRPEENRYQDERVFLNRWGNTNTVR